MVRFPLDPNVQVAGCKALAAFAPFARKCKLSECDYVVDGSLAALSTTMLAYNNNATYVHALTHALMQN
jgi:hypothetical protein